MNDTPPSQSVPNRRPRLSEQRLRALATAVAMSSHYMTASCGNEAVHALRDALQLGPCDHHPGGYS